jgi:hypothetical protein
MEHHYRRLIHHGASTSQVLFPSHLPGVKYDIALEFAAGTQGNASAIIVEKYKSSSAFSFHNHSCGLVIGSCSPARKCGYRPRNTSSANCKRCNAA